MLPCPMWRLLYLVPVLLLFLVTADQGAGQAGNAATLNVVKYDGMGAAVRALRGKVIVVDFWKDD